MNGINLATAFHRLARSRQGKHYVDGSAFSAMLASAEYKAKREMEVHDGSLPANCCTIIAWSCATLRTFRESLFLALVKIASQNTQFCKTYEVTNLLWACAQYQKQCPNLPVSFEVQNLVAVSVPFHFCDDQLLVKIGYRIICDMNKAHGMLLCGQKTTSLNRDTSIS